MSTERTNIATFLQRYEAGEFSSRRVDVQIAAGWFDWFCKDESLTRRLVPLASFLKQIAFSKKVDLSNHYVFFKNNCPMVGGTYDSFSICDLKTGDVQYFIGFLPAGTYGRHTPSRVEVAPVHEWKHEGKDRTLVFPDKKNAAAWFMDQPCTYETEMH